MNDRLLEKIVHLSNGDWQVQSEKGKNLGTYKTKKEAEDRLQQVHYFKYKNEDLELDVADGGVPSLHSKKDDRYGHHNYKIEDPDLKRRLAEANPHLAKFLDDHYVWYLIAWAKGIDDGTSYQGFLNIYDDENRWTKVHGSYSDGYRPEPDLVKDIVFNSIEEDLDLDSTYDTLEPGHLTVEGDNSYYVLSQQQAGIFMPEYIEFCKKHFDAEDVEFLEETYAWAVNDPDGYHDVSMIKDEVNVYVIVWDDNGDSQEQAIDIENFKANGWDSIVDFNLIPDYNNLYEDLELDTVDYTYDPELLVKTDFWDSADLIAQGIAKEAEDKENGVKRWGIAPGNYIIKFFETFNDAYTEFLNYKMEPWEDYVELTCQDCAVLRRQNEHVQEDIELDVVKPQLSDDVRVLTPEQFKVIKDYFDNFEIKHKHHHSAYEYPRKGGAYDSLDQREMYKAWYDNFIRKHEQGIMLGDKVALMSTNHDRIDICRLNSKGNYQRFPDACTFVPTEIKEKALALKEDLDLDIEKVTSKIKFKDITTDDGIVIGKRVVLPEDRKNLLYTLLSEVGDVRVLDEFMFSDRYDCELSYYPPKNSYPGKAYLNFRDKSGDLKYVTGFGIFGLFIPDEIFDAVTEETVKEDLDLDLVPYTDDWKVYHDTLDNYFSLPIYDAERLVMERGHESSWFIAYYLDGTWLSGAYHDLSEELNGFMTFDEAFMKFKETEIGEDERLVVCYHQGAEYDENDELDFGEEDYPILAKGSEATEAQLFENLELEPAEPHSYDKKYLVKGTNYNPEDIIAEYGDAPRGWYLCATTGEGFTNCGALNELKMGNGEFDFEEAYQEFLNYEFEWDEVDVYLIYCEPDNDYDNQEFSIMIRYNEHAYEEDLDEDLDLDTLGDNLLEPYLIPISDDDIIEKLPQDYNIYILPDGTVGYVEEDAIEMGSDLEDAIFDYIEKEVITIFASGRDSMEGTVTYIHVGFPKNRLTQAQVDVLLRNKEWLWESRIPEDSEDFAGTSEYEYATDYFGYYGIAVSNTNADAVDTFLYLNGYIPELVEDIDLDIIEDAPRLIRDGKSFSEYGLSDNNVKKLINLITDKNRVDILEKALERNSESGLLAIYHDPDFLEYDIKLGSLVSCLDYADKGLEADLSIAKSIDKMFNFSYTNDWLNRPTNEDLDLDSIDTTSRVTKFKNPEGWNVYQLDSQSVDLKENILKVFKEYYPEGYLPLEVEKLEELTGYSWILTCIPRSILKDHGIMRIIVKDDAGSTMEMYDEFTHKTIVEAVVKLLDSEVKPVEEDLDLDVQSIKPEQVGRSTESHRKYRISMAALYRLRELKKDVYGETYGISGGYYLDNLVERVETGDEDLAGDIYLEVFNMNNEIEYRLSFGDYCICTLVQLSPMEFEGSASLELASAIEKELGLPELSQKVVRVPVPDIAELLDDDFLNSVDEDLDLDLVTSPTEKLIKQGSELSGLCRIGLDNKQKFIDYAKEHPESVIYDAGMSVNSGTHEQRTCYHLLNWLIDSVWVYFPEDLGLKDDNTLSRFKGKLFVMCDDAQHLHESYIFTVNRDAAEVLTQGAVNTELIGEDLDLDPVDENQIDDKIKEVIKRFLLDMGEYCVTIGDVLFEANPAGARIHDDRAPIRDAAYKVHNGEVTFYYPDELADEHGRYSDQAEVDEWYRIEAAATIDKATDPSNYLKGYHESNTVSYEKALLDLGELWGYSREEIENDLISQI